MKTISLLPRLYASVVVMATGFLLASNSAMSATVSIGGGTVTLIETSYLPGLIVLTLSSGDSSCPAGKYITYTNSNVDNMKMTYAALLANMLSGRQVYAYYETSNVSSGPWGINACHVSFLGTY